MRLVHELDYSEVVRLYSVAVDFRLLHDVELHVLDVRAFELLRFINS